MVVGGGTIRASLDESENDCEVECGNEGRIGERCEEDMLTARVAVQL